MRQILCALICLAFAAPFASAAPQNSGPIPRESTCSGDKKVNPGDPKHTNGPGVSVTNPSTSGGTITVTPGAGAKNCKTNVRGKTGVKDAKVEDIKNGDTVTLGSSTTGSVSGTGGSVSISGGSTVTVTNTTPATAPPSPINVVGPNGNVTQVLNASTAVFNT